jgi:oxygen-independent coproporphyrinogen-3 oxidase
MVAALDGPAALVTADDGVTLALYRAAASAPRQLAPPLLLVHGTFSNRWFFLGARERGLAHALAARGWDVWVAELRGHGRSGAAGRRNAWHFEDWIRRDAPALILGVLRETGRDHLVWIGHSAGGITGVAYAGLGAAFSDRIAGLVTAGAPAPTGMHLLQVPLVLAGLGVTRIMGRFPARWIGIGPEDEHAGIMRQWLRWNLRGRWEGEDGTDYFANCATIRCPTLALAGAGDWLIAPPGRCADLLAAVGAADRTLQVCGRAQGFGEDFTHDRLLASRPARETVWPLLADWLAARFG